MNDSCLLMDPSPSGTTDPLCTRPTLLFRLRDWRDAQSWNEFYGLYHQFVLRLARCAGLSAAEADEVVQDVFLRVAQTIAQFESNPARGTFRGWLAQLTRWRIADRRRALSRAAAHLSPAGDASSAGTDPIQGFPDTSPDEEATAEAEWQKVVLEAALQRLALVVPAKHFQIFDLYARRDWPVLKVARELGVNPAQVYLVAHRLTKKLRAEVETLRTQIN